MFITLNNEYHAELIITISLTYKFEILGCCSHTINDTNESNKPILQIIKFHQFFLHKFLFLSFQVEVIRSSLRWKGIHGISVQNLLNIQGTAELQCQPYCFILLIGDALNIGRQSSRHCGCILQCFVNYNKINFVIMTENMPGGFQKRRFTCFKYS